MKKCIKQKGVFFARREKNDNTLFDLGISRDSVIDVIFKLTVSDYHKGPEDDHNGSDGDVWVFKHPVSGCVIYIKLKLYEKNGEDFLKIISFHK